MMDPREQYQADTGEGLLVDINASAAKSWASPRGRVELRGCEVFFRPKDKPRTEFLVCEGKSPRDALLRAMLLCGWWRPMATEAKAQAIADLCDRVRAAKPDADGVRSVTVVLEGSYSRSDEHDVRMDAAKVLDRDGWAVTVWGHAAPPSIVARPKPETEVRAELAKAQEEHDRASAKLACVTAQAKRLGEPL